MSSINLGPNESIPVSKVYFPSVDLSQDKKYIAFMGAKDTVYQEYTASTQSNSSIVFNIQIPNRSTVVDRRMFIRTNFTVSYIGTAGTAATDTQFNFYTSPVGGQLETAGAGPVPPFNQNFGLRQFPLHSCATTVSCDLNSSRYSLNASELIHAMSWSSTSPFYRGTYNSTAAGMPDMYSTYAVNNATMDAYQYAVGPPAHAIPVFAVDNRNPLADYSFNTLEETRNYANYCLSITSNTNPGAPLNPTDLINFSPDLVTNGASLLVGGADANNTISFTFEVIEPVCVSPLIYSGPVDEPGLFNLVNMQIAYNLGDLRRMISGLPAFGISGNLPPLSTTVTINNSSLLTRLYTLHNNYPIKQVNYWNVYDVQRFIQSSNGTITPELGTVLPTSQATGKFTITSQVINFSGHPKLIYCYVKNQNIAEQTFDATGANGGNQIPDTFARIQNINITYNNKLVLSSAKESDIYQMSVRNGLLMSWAQWRAFTGSVVIMNPATDFSLNEDNSNGVRGEYSFQITVMALRQPSLSARTGALPFPNPLDLYVAPVYEGFLYVNAADGIFKTIFSPLTPLQVEMAPIEFGMYQHYNNLYHLYGSGFFDTLRSIANKVSGFIGNIGKVATPILGAVAPEFLPIASAVTGVANAVHGATGGRNVTMSSLRSRIKRTH